MIRLVDANQPTPSGMLDARGGFAWWYVDIVDDEGNGAVVIWSWGLPFVPGYTDAARRGEAPPARERPSLNIAIYRRGAPTYYLLQTYDAADAWYAPDDGTHAGERATHASPVRGEHPPEVRDTHGRGTQSVDRTDRWKVGGSTFERLQDAQGTYLTAQLRGTDPATGHAFRGELRLRGITCREPGDESTSEHAWGPISTGAAAELSFRVGERAWQVRGTGYHDRNWSPVHLDGLGIRRWTWFRAASDAGTRILYVLESTTPGQDRTLHLWVDPDGNVQMLDDTSHVARTSLDRFGVRYPSELRVGDGAMRLTSIVDRGPFYLRGLATWNGSNAEEHGIAEVVVPPRVDRGLTRPLVRMAVDDVSRRRSMWFPLFSGPADGRVRRLLRGGEAQP